MSQLALLGGEKTRIKPYVTHAIIGDEERRRVADVLDSGILSGFVGKAGAYFLGGKQVRELEGMIKAYFGCQYAVTVNSATAGLHAAIAACDIGPGDEVIVTPYTMSASATAIVMQHAVPVFVDIEENFCTLDPQRIEAAITPYTKAIVVVHLFGHPANIDAIMMIARKHHLKVIEDCAQAPGAMYKGAYVGTIGDIGVFSLNQHKTITSGEGGFAITQHEALARKMQLVRNHGEVVAEDLGQQDIVNIVGYNYRMTELEAAVAIGQFRRLDELNTYRIMLADVLTKELSGLPQLVTPLPQQDCTHVYFVYPMRWREEVAGISRDVFAKALVAEGIPVGTGYVRPIYWEPMYQQKIAYGSKGHPFVSPSYQGTVDYSRGICPVVERMHMRELLMTGICRYPHTQEDILDAAKAIKKIITHQDELDALKVNG